MTADILLSFIQYLANTLLIAILIRIVMSWMTLLEAFKNIESGPIARVVWDITEPILGPLRRRLPSAGGIDFSPMIAMILIYVLRGLAATYI
jgi:YggT family protein